MLFCAILNSSPSRFVWIVWIVLLVLNGSLSRVIVSMVSGLTSASYNCCVRIVLLVYNGSNRQWPCWWFLDLLLIQINVASILLASFQTWNCERCVYVWTWCFCYAFFGSVFSFRCWWVLVRVSDFRCKPNTPDLTRMRNRKFSLCFMIYFFFW